MFLKKRNYSRLFYGVKMYDFKVKQRKKCEKNELKPIKRLKISKKTRKIEFLEFAFFLEALIGLLYRTEFFFGPFAIRLVHVLKFIGMVFFDHSAVGLLYF